MKYFVAVATLFVLGSVTGYLIEVLFRRIFTAKRWMNPGFLVGPYLPIYGFGTIALYAVWSFDLSLIGLNNQTAEIIIKIIAIGVIMTLVELIAGLIFIKGMKIKLWDYSDRWGNFKGLICPLFSLLWLLVGSAYYFLVHPYLIQAILFISENPIYDFFVGGVVGAMIVDCCYSLHIGFKIKKAAGEMEVKYDEFKLFCKDKAKENGFGKHMASFAVFLMETKEGLDKSIAEFKEKHPIIKNKKK